jgi:hypothetical protein
VLVGAETWGENLEGFPEHEGGFLGEIVHTADPKLIHNLFLKDDPVLADQLAVYGAAMAIPIHTRLDPGDWLVILSRDARSFSRDDLPEAIMRGNLIGGVLESLTITQKLEKAQALIQHEVNGIADIERQLLFDSKQDVPGMDFAASYLTFDRAGGDYFRFIELPRENGTDTPAPWAHHYRGCRGPRRIGSGNRRLDARIACRDPHAAQWAGGPAGIFKPPPEELADPPLHGDRFLRNLRPGDAHHALFTCGTRSTLRKGGPTRISELPP